jgi:hypothetical protein
MESQGPLPYSQGLANCLLSQLNPVHKPTTHFLKIHFKIIFPSTPGSPQGFRSLRYPHQNPHDPSELRVPSIFFFWILSPAQ